MLRGKDGADSIPAITQQLRDRARHVFCRTCRSRGDGRQPFVGREEFLETSGDLYLGVRATPAPARSRDGSA